MQILAKGIGNRQRRAGTVICVLMMVQVIALCLFLGSGTAVYGAEAEAEPVKVGFFAMDGYHMIDENGVRSGYGYDFLQMVTRYVSFDYEYIGYDKTWKDMQEMLENGEIDMVTSMRRTEEREEVFDFSLPIGTNSVLLNVSIDDGRYTPGDYDSYNGMHIGLLRGNSRNEDVAEFAEEKGFFYTEEYYDTAEELSQALARGRVDAIGTSSLRKTTGEKTLDKFATEDFYVAVRKGDKELLSDINYAISQMDNVEGDWKNKLYYAYYRSTENNAVEFTEREKKIIEEYSTGGKVLLASSNCDKKPYSYVEDGELKGILPDIFAKYMAMCGMEYEFYAPESREEYQELAASSTIPVFLDARLGASLTEDNGSYISPVYITLNVARVTRKNFDGEIKTIAVTANQGKIPIEEVDLDHVAKIEYDDRRSAIQAVADGKADATYVYSYTAAKYVNEDITGQLVYTVFETPSYDYSISVSKDMPHEILGIITKCIYALPKSEIDDIIAKYTSFSAYRVSVADYLKINPWLGLTAVMFVTVVALAAFVVISKEHSRQKLLEEEQRSIKKLQEQMNIINALGSEYDPLYLVNLDEDTIELLRADVRGTAAEEAVNNVRYTDVIRGYINKVVVPEQREQLLEKTKLETLKKELPEKGILPVNYQRIRDGAVSCFQMNCARVPSEDGISRMVVGYRNVDDVVAHEREQQRQLREALAEARHASAAKTTFLSNMSHDIRTPMNAIIGFATIALRRLDNTEQVKDFLEKVLAAGNHLLRLINDILDMSRIESGRMQLHEQECNLSGLIHDLVNMNQSQIKAKQLDFYVDTFMVKDEDIYADPLKLNQVLINLMSNAIKYTPSTGRVSLRIIQHPCDVPDYAKYEFIVKDNGMGMSEEFLKHIFEPFEREASTTRTGIEGTGLGMAITRNIVDMMGGTITATSEKGKGSEFRVVLSFRIQPGAKKTERIEELEGLRILVVDDDFQTCESLSGMLEEMGMQCEWTISGREAVCRAQKACHDHAPFHIYLIDWLMPEQNGIETARQIHKVAGAEAQIIIVTAYDWSDMEEEAREAGVTAFCSKPLFKSDLKAVLGKVHHAVPEEEEKEEWTEADFIGKRVLLVEDNELNREIATEILEEAGFLVEAVPDGTDAVRRMEQVEEFYYDIILMDIQMPIMNGYEATRVIRAMKRADVRRIPIFAMSANALEEDREKTLASGMNEHIAKPFEVSAFLEILHRYIRAGA